ncbi:hypothetical protein [Streptomyces buecherae]|uniref:hypothetical protein n=1 Tax=Streptomyces buecherae TaxID=2763006 RepID=UPI00164D964F|nr:hypothetical protein [Streptomyces buecherae]QNJ42030.1 hypothetical protein H7H31_21395 [Streptomyces buecherae]
MPLPNDHILLQEFYAGLTPVALAEKYGVTRQGVQWRLNKLGIYIQGDNARINQLLPWNLSGHPRKRAYMQQRSYRGARAYMQRQQGQELSQRAVDDLEAFERRLSAGQILAFDPESGFSYVQRTPEDGNLIFRWPSEAPLPKGAELRVVQWST